MLSFTLLSGVALVLSAGSIAAQYDGYVRLPFLQCFSCVGKKVARPRTHTSNLLRALLCQEDLHTCEQSVKKVSMTSDPARQPFCSQ